MNGKVYLVGAGPGEPDLITVKGKKCLEKADVVIYDYLANPILLEYAPCAEKIYVGKKSANHTVNQERINEIIVEKAKEGKTVVRLKGGDPFIFGRGGEEALALAKNGIEYEIVPGVTSGIAAPIYAGIPLTMRGVNSSIAFATGHETDEKDFTHLDWYALSKMGTLIFYMGVKNMPQIVENLIKAGMSKETPCALIRWATYPEQKVLTGNLSNINEKIKKTGFKAPAITVIGEVVSLRKDLVWFEKKPLFGQTVLVTRTKEQAGKLSERLRELGSNVIEIPTIEVVPPESFDPLDKALENIDSYNCLILTSVNGVKYFFERLKALRKDVRILHGLKICAIGPATGKAIEEKGLFVDIMPEKYVAESVLEKLKEFGISNKKFLLARAKVARDVIPDEIKKAGGQIDVVTVYETVIPSQNKEKLKKILSEKDINFVTFTSSSTVKNFFQLLGEMKVKENIAFASIGPVTSQTLREKGYEPNIEAKVYTIDGLVDAIVSYVKNQPSH